MNWFAQNKDFIAIVIATLAVIVSLVTVLAQLRRDSSSWTRTGGSTTS